MIVLFDSSKMMVHTKIIDNDTVREFKWEAGRSLAKELLKYLAETLAKNNATFDSITGIGVFRGPGSYTGLRIGLSVLNTLADSYGIPIVGETGDDWHQKAVRRLTARQNDRLVLPEYGGDAHTTIPRK